MANREMANWIFMWDDAASDGTTAIHAAGTSTADSGYPDTALLDADRQTCFKTSDTSSPTVAFDLGSAQTIKAVGLLNHNSQASGAGDLYIRYSTNGTDWSNEVIILDASYYDDDFFTVINGGTGRSARYWQVYWPGTLSAGLYVGRVYLAKSLYEIPSNKVALGATKGYLKQESVSVTPGGIEHRVSRGIPRRVISAVVPAQVDSSTIRTNLLSLVAYCEVNDKCFVMSSPYGTTTYTTTTRYGAAIHARLNTDDWRYAMQLAGLVDIPLEIVEVL